MGGLAGWLEVLTGRGIRGLAWWLEPRGGGGAECGGGGLIYFHSKQVKNFAKEVPMAAADADLAGVLGGSAEVVESLRRERLLEGEHWGREGNRVVYTDAGVAEMRTLLDLPAALPEKKVEPPPEVLCVIVRLYPNPAFVRVRTPAAELVAVRVRAAQRLQLKSNLRCRQLVDGRWECCHPGHAVPLPSQPQTKKGD